jgi:hypothetical protein
MVRKIRSTMGSEAEQERMLAELKANVSHPEVLDLIFFPPNGKDLSPEEIVDTALSYGPIRL